MRKIRIGQAATVLLAIAASALTAGAGTANAAADPTCTGYGANALVKRAFVKSLSTKNNLGYVELCQRWTSSGQVFWGNVRLTYQMSPGHWGNGRLLTQEINIPESTVQSTCINGGTGRLTSTHRACSTGGVPAYHNHFELADAYIYNEKNNIIAVGSTGWND